VLEYVGEDRTDEEEDFFVGSFSILGLLSTNEDVTQCHNAIEWTTSVPEGYVFSEPVSISLGETRLIEWDHYFSTLYSGGCA